jgi:hypothetical protein
LQQHAARPPDVTGRQLPESRKRLRLYFLTPYRTAPEVKPRAGIPVDGIAGSCYVVVWYCHGECCRMESMVKRVCYVGVVLLNF